MCLCVVANGLVGVYVMQLEISSLFDGKLRNQGMDEN
jgi:hypothetical protein